MKKYLLLLCLTLSAQAADRYWVLGTANWTAANTVNWSATSGGLGGETVPGAGDNVFFDSSSSVANAAYTVTLATDTALCLNLNMAGPGAGNAVTWAGSVALTISGNMNIQSSGVVTITYTGAITFNATTSKTITSNGKTYLSAFTFNGVGGTWALADALSTTGALTLTNGTFDAANGSVNAAVTASSWSSSNSNTRALIVGSGAWSLTGNNATVWLMITCTNFTLTRGSAINLTYSGGTGTRTIDHVTDATEANSPDISITAGTDIISFTVAGKVHNLNFTGFGAGSWANIQITIYGNLTVSSSQTVTAGTKTLTFAATSGTQVITSATKNLDFPITINAPGATVQLADNLAMGTATNRGLTLTAGTLDLNSLTLTHFGSVTNTGAVTRVFAFGTNGAYTNTLTTGSTVWNATGSGFTTTGTGTMKYSGTHSGSSQTFIGGGYTYPNLWYTNAASGFFLLIDGNTFVDFKCTDTNTQTIKFTAGTTTTCSTFTVSGAAANLITVTSITAATHTLNVTSTARQISDYLNVSYSTVTPIMRLYARNSTDGGNNYAWVFGWPSMVAF